MRNLRRHAGHPAHADPGGGPVLRSVLPVLFAASADDRIRASGGEAVSNGPPTSTRDLRLSERRFLAAMQRLGYGRFESLRIRCGEFVLEPAPTAVRSVKFGTPAPNQPDDRSGDFELKDQIAQLFGLIRGIDAGEIRVLEVRGGLPFTMEIAE